MNIPIEYVSASTLARTRNISRRTLSRWLANEALAFPRPIEVNSRLYWPIAEVEAWFAARNRVGISGAVDMAETRKAALAKLAQRRAEQT